MFLHKKFLPRTTVNKHKSSLGPLYINVKINRSNTTIEIDIAIRGDTIGIMRIRRNADTKIMTEFGTNQSPYINIENKTHIVWASRYGTSVYKK